MRQPLPSESTLMDNLMQNIGDSIYFKDLDGKFVLINKKGAKRAGFDTPEALKGKSDLDIFTEEHSREAFNDEQRIIQTGDPLLGKEEKETWDDGHETWVSTTKLPLRNEAGKIIGTFGISRDITEHKKAELLAAKYAEENRQLCDEMQSDIQMAMELQKTFLPRLYPTYPDGVDFLHSAARFCHYYHATGDVGGDFCSIRKLSETEAGILLCDVAGHGVRSALITALMRAIVEEISQKETNTGRFLQHMNRALYPIALRDERFFALTACYLVLNVADGTLHYSIAGHPVPILLGAGDAGAEWLLDDVSSIGPPLTMASEVEYQTCERQLNPGDAIIMYTDGLFEAADVTGEEFGQDRLMALADENRQMLLTELFPLLVDTVRKYSATGDFDDDVCLAGCRFSHRMTI